MTGPIMAPTPMAVTLSMTNRPSGSRFATSATAKGTPTPNEKEKRHAATEKSSVVSNEASRTSEITSTQILIRKGLMFSKREPSHPVTNEPRLAKTKVSASVLPISVGDKPPIEPIRSRKDQMADAAPK